MDTSTSGSTTKRRRAFARRDWLTFDRLDYRGTTLVLGIAVVGSVLFGLVLPILDAVSNAPLPVAYTTKVDSGIELPRGATHVGSATVPLLLEDATAGERLIQALPGFLSAAMTIAVAWLLFQLLRSTQDGEPFTRRNVTRINLTALIVGVVGMLTQYAQGFANSAIYMTGRLPEGTGLSFEATLSPLPVVAMLVLSLVGEAFRRGVVIRNDVEGLV